MRGCGQLGSYHGDVGPRLGQDVAGGSGGRSKGGKTKAKEGGGATKEKEKKEKEKKKAKESVTDGGKTGTRSVSLTAVM